MIVMGVYKWIVHKRLKKIFQPYFGWDIFLVVHKIQDVRKITKQLLDPFILDISIKFEI
ncbi:hypothetical protein D3C76_195790 [compost metagenome]